jgi:hypothetical protein
MRCTTSVSLVTHAQCDDRSRCADARRRIEFVALLNVNSTARAGYGDEPFAGAAGECASGTAFRLGERVQAACAGGSRWAGRTCRSGRADAAARTVRTGQTGWPRRTLLSHRARRSWRPLFSCGARRPLVALLTLRSWRTRAEQTSGGECGNCDRSTHCLRQSCKGRLSSAYRSAKSPNFQLA